jgi:predicted nicotinamide N-methyase
MADDPSDDHYADIGFMFEGSEASTLKHYEFQHDHKVVKIALNVVDEVPGAVQSGHYLWPGAPTLAKYLLQLPLLQPTAVVELGAGCALVSVTALQVFDSIQYLVATDHDPGTLQRAEGNHDATLEYLGDERFAERLLTVPIRFESLTWGDEQGAAQLLSDLQRYGEGQKFDLVLGSDLIYDKDVVEPLFVTVSMLMDKKGTFLLSQSFAYDDATERDIDRLCSNLGLQRTIIQDDLSSDGGVKLQEFRWY